MAYHAGRSILWNASGSGAHLNHPASIRSIVEEKCARSGGRFVEIRQWTRMAADMRNLAQSPPMAWARHLVPLVGLLALLAGDALPDSGFASGVRWLGLTIIGVHFFIRAHHGYLRRRPYWTASSWRRFLGMCCIPLAAFLFLAWLLFALDSHLPFVGEAQTPTRSAWAAVSVLCSVIGGIGMAVAIEWLERGEASRQFGLPRWLTRAG